MKTKAKRDGAIWSWNLICVDCRADDEAVVAVQEELDALAEAMNGVAPEAVHLHVAITRSSKAGDYYVQTTLRVANAIVHADESAPEIADGVRAAFAALGEAAGAALGEERIESRGGGAPKPAFGAPLRAGEGPQSRRELVRDLFADNYARLLRYARRRVRFYERSGILTTGEVDPRELVDEAALRCLEEPLDALPRLDYLLWFHELVREELQRCCGEHRLQELRRGTFPKPRSDESGSDTLAASVAAALEAEEMMDEERVLDPAARSPEEAAEESDLVELVLERARSWPGLDREILTLHFVEGFSPDEIAQLEKLPVSRVREVLAAVTIRLRAMLRDEPYLR